MSGKLFMGLSITNLIIIMLMVVIIILLIAVIAKTYSVKEKFGSLERRILLSKATLASNGYDETNDELIDEDDSLNQKSKEGYVMGRNNMLFKGDFDYLVPGKKDKPSFRQSDKSVVEEIVNDVKEKVEQIAEQTSDSNIAVDSSIPTELTEEKVEETPEQKSDYITDKEENKNVELNESDDVISGAGKSLEATTPESFGLTRLHNDFSILKQGSTASEIAQTDDPANEQTSTDMKSFIKTMFD